MLLRSCFLAQRAPNHCTGILSANRSPQAKGNHPPALGSPPGHWSRLSSTCSMAAASGRIVESDPEVQQLAATARTVAVLGCKTEQQAAQPAFFVAAYLQQAGVNVIPVPVFYPDVTTILDKPVYRRVADIQEPIDILVMFRKPSDLMPHLPDIMAAPHRPRCVWLQSGITDPEFESALVDAGCLVVADRCIKVEHQAAAQHQGTHLRSPL